MPSDKDTGRTLGAGAIVLGPDTGHAALAGGVTAYVAAHASSHVIIVNPQAGALGRPIPATAHAGDGVT
jgi:hypothetical protein